MIILTIPWHILGLLGQPRRIGVAPYGEDITAPWHSIEVLMFIGGVILVTSALLLVINLLLSHFQSKATIKPVMEYAESLHPVLNLPKLIEVYGTLLNIQVVIF